MDKKYKIGVKESSRLRSYLTGYEDDITTTTRIKLIHRQIYVGWAGSIAYTAAKPLPYAILDKEDKFEWSNKETTPSNARDPKDDLRSTTQRAFQSDFSNKGVAW